MGKKANNPATDGEWVLEEMLKVAMEDELNDHAKYRRLGKMAKNRGDRQRLFEIADDEARHYKLLTHIYKKMHGGKSTQHKGKGHAYKIHRFDAAIGKSIAAEYETIAFQREILCRLDCEEFKTVLRSIMAAEQRHAQILENMLGFCQGR